MNTQEEGEFKGLPTRNQLKGSVTYHILELIDDTFFFLSTAHQDVLKEVEVEYVTMPGWNTSTTDCRTFEDLPVNAQKYVRKAEELIGIPSKYLCTLNLTLLLQYVARTFSGN